MKRGLQHLAVTAFVLALLSAQASAGPLYVSDNNGALHGVVVLKSTTLGYVGPVFVPDPITAVAADTSGIYVASAYGLSKYAPNGTLIKTVYGTIDDNFDGLAVVGDTLYLADNNGAAHGVVEWNATTLAYIGPFFVPDPVTAIAADKSGIYVASAYGLSKYTPDGTLIKTVYGTIDDNFDGLAVVGDTLYLADNNGSAHGVVEWNATTLDYIGPFFVPDPVTAIAADTSGVYVTSTHNVSKYTPDGTLITSFDVSSDDNLNGVAVVNPAVTPAGVPEPAGLGFVGFGLAAIAARRRRRT